MAVYNFPPVESATEDGLLAFGGDLEVETLLHSYKSGIFPWPISYEYPLAWFSPDPRGVIKCNNLHISKSTAKLMKKNRFDIKFNTNFEAVIENCQTVKRVEEPGTWITDELKEAYIELFNKGYAYSVESYLDKKLVGGIYGVHIEGIVSAESMFFHESNASKIALIKLVQYLNSNNIELLDTQMITPIVASLGGTEIKRSKFISSLHRAAENNKGKKLFF